MPPRPRAVDLWEDPKYYTGPSDPLRRDSDVIQQPSSSSTAARWQDPAQQSVLNANDELPVSLRLKPRGHANGSDSKEADGPRVRAAAEVHLPKFKIPGDTIQEEDVVIAGEDPTTTAWDGNLDKPIRFLTHYTVFDVAQRFKYIPLDRIELFDAAESKWGAFGTVLPTFRDPEAAAEFDDLNGDGENEAQRVQINTIKGFAFDYKTRDE